MLRERAPTPPRFIGQSTWTSRIGSRPRRRGMARRDQQAPPAAISQARASWSPRQRDREHECCRLKPAPEWQHRSGDLASSFNTFPKQSRRGRPRMAAPRTAPLTADWHRGLIHQSASSSHAKSLWSQNGLQSKENLANYFNGFFKTTFASSSPLSPARPVHSLACVGRAAFTSADEKGRPSLSGPDRWLDSANPYIRSALLSEVVSASVCERILHRSCLMNPERRIQPSDA